MSSDTPSVPSTSALEPLFHPWDEPNKHRIKSKTGGRATAEGRRSSPIAIAQNLRAEVGQWRHDGYPGASRTTQELLNHWFNGDHRKVDLNGDTYPFKYFFCQREAIEALIYLRECRSIVTLSGLVNEFGPGTQEERYTAALGVSPEDDIWPRYAFKLATGAGKTKCMSLAMVWSYFHALYEPDSPMCKHFLLIAPNLIVFERLKEDFNNGKIFEEDPLIPPAWKADFNPSVVLQGGSNAALTSPVIYLTNIHRLYEPNRNKRTRNEDTYDWMGPNVSKANALDTSQALRDQITGHPKLMILNDEAHHVWDPDSTWNECLNHVRNAIFNKTGNNLVAQLDFSATPRDNKGDDFKHIVCDTPLGEAIDAGIVKTPVIGEGRLPVKDKSLVDNAAERYQRHLQVGYKLWLDSYNEWKDSGKKTLLFVMTEDAKAADQIYQELNTNEAFKELNGKVLNLHTRLKVKVVTKGRGASARKEFVESDKEISDEDLRTLRELSRELDHDTSPYRCIVSVLMLREGWDVKNVTTIVPLRAYSSDARILPEQTLGRGLRRMTPPGEVNEIVTVVEHPEFAKLYGAELEKQGAIVDIVDVEKVPRISTTIFPDAQHKDLEALKLLIPALKPGFQQLSVIEPPITFDDLKQAFSQFKPLPVGEKPSTEIDYVGRHIITDEIVQQLKIELSDLLMAPAGCISYYRTMIERLVKMPSLSMLMPLLERFIQEILFDRPINVYNHDMTARLADDDVREHILRIFVPMVRERSRTKTERKFLDQVINVCQWKAFQATNSATHPVIQGERTPFNLVPCDRQFEVVLTQFLDRATDVQSFCKNAGPQALRIDYINAGGQLGLYAPDFIVRTSKNKYLLLEGKGREDKDVALKAKAANEWCKSASSSKVEWAYLYITQLLFGQFNGTSIEALSRMMVPSLQELLKEPTDQLKLPLAQMVMEAQLDLSSNKFIKQDILNALPPTYRQSIDQAIRLFTMGQQQKEFYYSSVFTPLFTPLDIESKTLVYNTLIKYVPHSDTDQRAFFDVTSNGALDRQAQNLRKTLIYKTGLSPIGLLRFCLTFENRYKDGGIFKAIEDAFRRYRAGQLTDDIDAVNDFRNSYIAHTEGKVLTDTKMAERNLKHWIDTILKLYSLNHPATNVVQQAATAANL